MDWLKYFIEQWSGEADCNFLFAIYTAFLINIYDSIMLKNPILNFEWQEKNIQ